jgi:hypothetical protein
MGIIMDISTDLSRPDESTYRQYILTLIEETFKNFVEVDQTYFKNLDKPISLKSFIGERFDLDVIYGYELYLNKTLKESFGNLRLNITDYKFVPDDTNNSLTLQVSLSSGLIDENKRLVFALDLDEGS